MTEELDQLLRNLKLHSMHAVYDEHLRAADQQQITYTDFVAPEPVRSAAPAPTRLSRSLAHPGRPV